jgi:hypothetical protein
MIMNIFEPIIISAKWLVLGGRAAWLGFGLFTI